MKISFILLAIASIALSCETNYHKQELYGSYDLQGLKFSLQPDGKFHYESSLADCFGHETADVVDGNFEVKAGYVLLRPVEAHRKYFEWELIKDKKLVWDSLRPVRDFISGFYDSLLILPAGKKIFLLGANSSRLEEDRYKRFTYLSHIWGGASHFLNAVNANDTAGFHWRFLNKSCKSCHETKLEKALPKEWVSYLTNREIKATVKQVDSIEIIFNVPYVTIDAGENQGIHRGYGFFSDSSDFITILEVYPNFSKGASYHQKPKSLFIGQSLSTVKPKQKSQRKVVGSFVN